MDVLKEDKGMMTTGTGDQNGVDLSSILLEPRTHSLDYNNSSNYSMIQDGEVAKRVQVSHVPVSESDGSVYTLPSDSSTNTLYSFSQSILCSSLTTSKSAVDLNNTISTGKYAHESTKIEKIRASKSNLITDPPEQEQVMLSLKSMCTNETIDDGDVMKPVSNEANDKLSRRISFESSIVPTRPSKKTRIEDNDVKSTNESTRTTTSSSSIPLTLDAICSVGTTKVRSVSISSPMTTAPPHQEQQQSSFLTLLAQQDQDSNFLNPLHVFIRNQIEVFTATTTELAQPAPGRKQPIQLNQVGLRCIHCRHLPNQKRVKRATCYPSSVGRVYHSVSDMKFDHFSNCTELPAEARKTFGYLKADGKRGSGHNNKDNKKSPKTSRKGHSSSTAQYYQDSASRMGMVDSPGGIIYMMSSIGGSTTGGTSTKVVAVVSNEVSSVDVAETTKTGSSSFVKKFVGVSSDKTPIPRPPPQQQHQQQKPYQQFQIQQQDLPVANSTAVAASMLFHPISVPDNLNSTLTTEENNEQLKNLTATMSSNIMQSLLWNAIAANAQMSIDAANAVANQQEKNLQQQQQCHQHHNGMGKITVPLSAPEDSDVLNPVHCFVRKHVELFTADVHDITAPSPGRKTRVQFRQVGIRCKHCVKFPSKERVKRAVCYPPSIDGIYHSVSNMKLDHFGLCPGLPASAREEFTNIKKSCVRRGGSTNNNGGGKSTTRTAASSSTTTGTMNTAQYYHDSAIVKGLVDTDKGIRFGNDVVNHIAAAAAAASADTPNTNITTARAQALYERPTKFPTGMSALMMAASQATSI